MTPYIFCRISIVLDFSYFKFSPIQYEEISDCVLIFHSAKMSMIATDVKGILTIKFKPRTDHLTDQYSRIFMVKLLLACTVVTGISWYTDKMNCIIPSKGLVIICTFIW